MSKIVKGVIFIFICLVQTVSSQTYDYPNWETRTDKDIKIIKISREYMSTTIFFEYSRSEANDIYIFLSPPNTKGAYYIVANGQRYELLFTLGIGNEDGITEARKNHTVQFSATFEAIPKTVKSFDLLEGGHSGSWNFYGIEVEPSISCDEIEFVDRKPKPSFDSYLRGLKYAVIGLSDGSTPFAALEEYLYEIGFSKVFVSNEPYQDETNNLCDYTFVTMSWSGSQSGFKNIKLNFFSHCVPIGYNFSINKSVTADGGIATNTYNYFYNALMAMQPKRKPSYSSSYLQILEQRLTCWTETKVKNSFQTKGCDKLEGIYENSNSNEAKYRVAVKKIKENYYLIYLSGAINSGNWEEGEVKASLISTATPLFFKAKWIMADKSENDEFYVSFEQGMMSVIDPEKETSMYIKMYPTSSDNITSHSGVSASGTGFAITKNGLVITNNHVIDGAKEIKVKGVNGDFSRAYSAKLIIADKNNDLAIIKIDDYSFSSIDNVPYTIKTSSSSVGEDIFVLGYPLRATMGDEVKLTNGIISSKTGFQGDVTSYQISAPIQPGNSGGPLFNDKGELVGVINAKHVGAENASYAVKSSYLINLIDLLDYPPVLQKVSSVSGKPLIQQVDIIKEFVYIIEVIN